MNLKKKKLLDYILLIVLFMYFIFSNLSNHNVYSDIMIVVLSFFSIIMIISKKKIYINNYFVIYLVFVVYQFFLIFIGKIYNIDATLKMISTLMINFSILLMIYNIILNIGDMKKILKIYLNSSVISLAIIMILLRDSLFSGRLAHAYGEGAVSFYFLGNPIAISSNGIAFYCAISVLLCFYFYYKEKNIKYIIMALFLAFGCILTGSRKGLLVLAIYVIYFINFRYNGKYLKKLIVISVVSIVLYLVITEIPAFNKVIGYRVSELINNILGMKSSEGSIVAREKYRNYALELIPKNLWFGYGCGYFSSIYGNVTEINYLEILMSGGTIGLLIYYFNYLLICIKYIKVKNKISDLTKIIFIMFFSIMIYDIGSVTYSVRSILIVIIFLLGSMKLDIRGDEKNE